MNIESAAHSSPLDHAAMGPPVASLEGLMMAYQRADSDAAVALVDQLSPRIYRFFLHQCLNSADASDLLQEAWLRIHRMRHTYRPEMPLLPWVFAIAHRVRIDNFRKQRRFSREITVDALPEHGIPAVVPGLDSSFDDLLAALPESQREVLTMLKVDGLSVEDVARATSSSAGAVKQKAHRAYERLRQILSNPHGGGDRR